MDTCTNVRTCRREIQLVYDNLCFVLWQNMNSLLSLYVYLYKYTSMYILCVVVEKRTYMEVMVVERAT